MTRAALLIALVLAAPASAQFANRPVPGYVRVRLDTDAGPITVSVATRKAPSTTRNFLAYVDDGRFNGAAFYRSARSRNAPTMGFIQGGIRTDARRILPPFPLERTSTTGILHLDGTISMARRADPSSAGGNFFITVGPMPSMDAKGAYPGYAAFGRVVAGMPLVRRILAQPTGGGFGGQMLLRALPIRRAVRLDGAATPTGRVKPWLVDEGKRTALQR